MMQPIDQIQRALSCGKVSGSWLITGGFEFEKRHFIYDICSLLLNQNFNDINTFHPDVKWLECGLTEEAKKTIQKNILAGKAVDETIDLDRKREITVDDVRSAIQFLSLKGASDRWRILIINPADKMNENAANALLKILEEPSERSLIFLLCNNTGKILPTIRSRCRQIVLKPLSLSELKSQIQQIYPAIPDVDLVVSLAEGSLGLAKMICENDGIALYRQMLSVLVPIDGLSLESVKAFADSMQQTQASFDLGKRFLLNWLCDQARSAAFKNPFLSEDWIDLYQEASALFNDIDRIYLDKTQVIQTIIFKIAEVLK